MFLTRIGLAAAAWVTGDTSQIDLPRGYLPGLVEAEQVLARVKGIATRFTSADVGATRWWRASLRLTRHAPREAKPAPSMKPELSAPRSSRPSASRPAAAPQGATLDPRGAGAARRDCRAHRRCRRRPGPEPRLPQQGLRDQCAGPLTTPRARGAGRPGHLRRGRRARARARHYIASPLRPHVGAWHLHAQGYDHEADDEAACMEARERDPHGA